MRGARWLIILGVLVGSLLISASAMWFQAFRQTERPLLARKEAEPAASPQLACQQNPVVPSNVRRWCGEISDHAISMQFDPLLIAAVIQVESNGEPEALSVSGAVGLMQVMPRDGLASQYQCINGPCFASRPSMQELWDADFNIAYGTRYLAGLRERYQGDLREALKAYGPHDMAYAYADRVLSVYQSYFP